MEILRIIQLNELYSSNLEAINFMVSLKSQMQNQLSRVLDNEEVNSIRKGIENLMVIRKIGIIASTFLKTYGYTEMNLFCISKSACVILKELDYHKYNSNQGQQEFIAMMDGIYNKIS